MDWLRHPTQTWRPRNRRRPKPTHLDQLHGTCPKKREPPVPEGLTQVGAEWIYDEYARGQGIQQVGVGDNAADTGTASGLNSSQSTPNELERQNILNIFKN